MPGMLLILGLLGTFLGLGLALDKASTILQNSGGASVGAMGSAMQDLTSMMQGLGTKFKTSTWGIIAFILLKIWESINGFEDRRLIWCIADEARVGQHPTAAGKSQSRTGRVPSSVIDGVSQGYRLSAGRPDGVHERRMAANGRTAPRGGSSAKYSLAAKFRASQSRRHRFDQSGGGCPSQWQRASHNRSKSLEHLIGIAHSSDQTQAALRQFTESNQDNLAALQKAGTTMGDAALKVSESAAICKSSLTT